MNLSRQDMLRLSKLVTQLCTVVAASMVALTAKDASFPERPINGIVHQAPGGTNDITARIIYEQLAKQLGQPFVVNNRPGAGGNIGTQAVLRDPADGYTILFTISSTQAINPALYKDPGFDPVKDFAPVAAVGSVPNVLCVNPSFPANNLQEFISLVKSNPDKYQYASSGNGTLRSEEHTSELQSLMRISYAVFCLKKKQ